MICISAEKPTDDDNDDADDEGDRNGNACKKR